MEKILSVVVPTYNMEKFLNTCLSSFIIEEILDDIEILIVNDGSSDRSESIALEYVKKYPSSFKLINKENGGHGSTINKGIEVSSAKYFKVVDGDDFVEKEAFIDLIKSLKNTSADLVLSNFYWRDFKTGKLSKEVEELATDIEYYKTYKVEDIVDKTFLKMHSYTIKTEILKKMNKRIREKCFYVDVEYIAYPLPYINTVLFTRKPVYIYNIGMNSQSMDMKNMQKRCTQHEKVLDDLLEYYLENNKNDSISKALANICSRTLVSQYKIYLSLGCSFKENLLSLDKKIKKEYLGIYKSVRNPAIKILRESRYSLYFPLSLIVRLKYFL